MGWVVCLLFVGPLIYLLYGGTSIFPSANAYAFALCPLQCHWCATNHVSPHAADNEHINMYIPSQVNACLALQFHGPVSGWGSFRSSSGLCFLFIRWRKKNIVLNYWADTWLTVWLMKLKEKETEKARRNTVIVRVINARDNFSCGVSLKKYWHKSWLQGLW